MKYQALLLNNKIPKILDKNNRTYILARVYPNFIMYKDMETGVKECFSRHELGLVKQMAEPGKHLQKIHKR